MSKCPIRLEKGVDEEVCKDIHEIHRWVLCRTWDILYKGEARSFGEAERRAYSERADSCAVYNTKSHE